MKCGVVNCGCVVAIAVFCDVVYLVQSSAEGENVSQYPEGIVLLEKRPKKIVFLISLDFFNLATSNIGPNIVFCRY